MKKYILIFFVSLILPISSCLAGQALGGPRIFRELGLEAPSNWVEMSRAERFEVLKNIGIYPGPDGKYRAETGNLDKFFLKFGKTEPENWSKMSFVEKNAFITGKSLKHDSDVSRKINQNIFKKYFNYHILFARLSWILLFLILVMRPLFDLIGFKQKGKILHYRKQLGFLATVFALLHIIIFLYGTGREVSFLFSSTSWNFKNLFAWGTLGFFALLFPFITSNKFSISILKKYWKVVQKISYLAFVSVGVHVYLARGGLDVFSSLVFVWLLVFVLAFLKKK